MTQCNIFQASTREDIAAIRSLFIEYQDYLDINLDFQGFGEELSELPGKYAAPKGRLLLARCDNEIAGCVAFYRVNAKTCELKRLYVRRSHWGKGAGKMLFEAALTEAKQAGYKIMRLDSLRRLSEAGKLYSAYGFKEILPFNDNPHADVYYMERIL
ncbi:MAG: GNAT family N-acetyltransferase [Alphaproteobacteria bacterium]|nr:GNAT family N-acetyltransferase [Alphaproteobacteria bacterium]